MTKAEARRIVSENMIDVMRALGSSGWTIKCYYYNRCDEDDKSGSFKNQMSTDIQGRYEKAGITIYFDALDDEKDFLECLRHELIHVMLAPFDRYDDDVRMMMHPLDRMPRRALDQFYQDRYEALVLAVERMLDWGLGKNTKQLIATVRRRRGDE